MKSVPANDNWQTEREHGAGLWRILIIVYCHKILGRRVTKCIAALIFCFAFPFMARPRKFSRDFLDKVARAKGVPAKKFSTFRHLLSFVFSLVDKLAGWSDAIGMDKLSIKTPDGWREINRVFHAGQGAFVICSHLGNIELFRAAFLNDEISERLKINILMATKISPVFSKAMRRINRRAGDKLIEILSLGIDTAVKIEEKIAAGEMVIMAGDRILGRATKKSAGTLSFLGTPANFPNGVYRFAASLACPVFAIFTLPENNGGGIYVYELKNVPAAEENDVRARAETLQKQFVALLEKMTLEHPYQWFNFFNFWKQ